METSKPSLKPFRRQRAILLTTYRRNGTPVETPVYIAVVGDRAFICTAETTGKYKRIRNNPEVTIAPSTMRGKPTGRAIRARARVLPESESTKAAEAMMRKYPVVERFIVPLALRLKRLRPTYIELTPIEDS